MLEQNVQIAIGLQPAKLIGRYDHGNLPLRARLGSVACLGHDPAAIIRDLRR